MRLIPLLVVSLAAAPASAALIAGFDPARHDRFVDNTRVPNPTFLLAGSDLSGIGVGTNGGILISDRHVLAATHFRGGSYTFAGDLGDVTIARGSERILTTTTADGTTPSDVTLVTLARPVTALDALRPVALADDVIVGSTLFAYDQRNRVGRNLIDGGSVVTADGTVVVPPILIANVPNPTVLVAYDYDTPSNGGSNGLGIDEIGLEGGDSGHAAFYVLADGSLAAIGTHSAVVTGSGTLPVDPSEPYVSLSSLAAAYRTQIEASVAADGGQGLRFVAVPEPASTLAGLLAAGVLLRRQRPQPARREPEA